MVTYCQAEVIIRHFDIEELNEQTTIEEFCKEATAWVDTAIKNYASVPLSPVPDRIRNLCEQRVKLKYRLDRAHTPELASSLREQLAVLDEDLAFYVEKTYPESTAATPTAFIVGESET